MKLAHGWTAVLGVVALLSVGRVGAGEMDARNRWLAAHLLHPEARRPFSFVFDGVRSDTAMATWPATAEKKLLKGNRTQYTLGWTDPQCGLRVRCAAVEYADFPVVEWTVYFKNTGAGDTPILQEIQALDASFERAAGPGACVLHGIKGDSCTADSYEPYAFPLTPGTVKKFAPPGSGKSSDGPAGWPYFNLQMPGGGVIMAVGWPGQWAASLSCGDAGAVRVVAGQELTHLRLKPGEEIRTPLIAMLFWEGEDWMAAQNLWRRWYIAHNLPQVDGRAQGPIAQIQVDGGEEAIAYVEKYLAAGVTPDICWRDAGAGGTTWYPSGTGPYQGNDAWLNTGTWEIDATKYPRGFKPFSDWVRAHGMAFLLWFEVERVGDPESWLGKHPEWLLPGTSHGALLNEGDPAARSWLIDHVSGMIESQGLDWYREDMNGGGPLPAWRKADAPERQGITENLYVQGHLAFWDELRRRHPQLRIDSCASGGRRNDLETMRRAVPLLRSDFQFPGMPQVIEGNQGHTYGLSFWLPFQGSGVYLYEPYAFRSFYMASFGMGGLTPENSPAQQQAYAECRRIAPLMLGDYHPLTEYSLAPDRWIAWQFHRPEQGDGVVQAFRRGACAEAAVELRLKGLDPAAEYEFTDFDREGTRKVPGRELLEKGLRVEVGRAPGAGVITYRKAA